MVEAIITIVVSQTLSSIINIVITKIPNPDKVEEVVEAISEAVTSEVETELINASHTNVLLLRQVIQFLGIVQRLSTQATPTYFCYGRGHTISN